MANLQSTAPQSNIYENTSKSTYFSPPKKIRVENIDTFDDKIRKGMDVDQNFIKKKM